MQTFKKYSLILSMLVAGLGASGTGAQTYPTKPVRIQTTGTGAGGDLVSRMLATELSTAFGQGVVVENKNTTTLATGVAKSAPDGYTLMVWGGAFWLGPLLEEEVNYDPVKDFAPITGLSRAPLLLVVHPSVQARNVKELIALAKAKPGQLNYASAPTGSSSHIAGELLKSMAGMDFVMINYKGGSPQLTTDLLAGSSHFTVGQGASMGPEVKNGKLRALAVTTGKRSVLYPDLPAVAETVPGFVVETMFAMFAPAKTPDAILKRLNQESLKALDKKEVRDRLFNAGYETAGSTPEQLADYIKAEMTRVGKLAKNMKPAGG